MGIDYYSCEICGDIFPDVINYGHCSNCEVTLCESCKEKQVEKYGNPEEDSEAACMYGVHSPVKCDLCSGVIIRDEDILQFLLGVTNLTKDKVINMMREDGEYNERGNN